MSVKEILTFFRCLSFGGLLGAGVGCIIFLSYPHLFDGRFTFEAALISGSLLGAGLQQTIDVCLVKTFLLPFGRFIDLYGKLVQLEFHHRFGLVDEGLYKQIKSKLVRDYFLGPSDTASTQERMLPPNN